MALLLPPMAEYIWTKNGRPFGVSTSYTEGHRTFPQQSGDVKGYSMLLTPRLQVSLPFQQRALPAELSIISGYIEMN